MGISGLIITEEMVPQLQELLESAGIKVEKETYTEKQRPLTLPPAYEGKEFLLDGPGFCLHCENQKGERVKLRFGHLTIEPYPLSVAIHPLPQSLWKTFVKRERNKLVDEIITVLKNHGAQDFSILDKNEIKG